MVVWIPFQIIRRDFFKGRIMSRPKGVPNKKKQLKDEAKEKVEKEIKALEPEILTVEKVTEAVTHLKSKAMCQNCGDPKDMHYGSHKGHCNTQNCPCLEFK